MKSVYKVIRTDTADTLLRQIILYIAENFGKRVALERLEQITEMSLFEQPQE